MTRQDIIDITATVSTLALTALAVLMTDEVWPAIVGGICSGLIMASAESRKR